jgi:hypothetical protein
MIPLKVEDLNNEFFKKCVPSYYSSFSGSNTNTKPEDVEIVSADVGPAFEHKMGFMSTHARATIVAKIGEEVKRFQLFIKLIPDEEMFMDTLRSIRYDIKEIGIIDKFQNVLTDYVKSKNLCLELPFPRAFYADYSEEELKSVLVMYDAREEGYETLCLSIDWDLPHLLMGVKTLAKFNATSLSYRLASNLSVDELEKKFPYLATEYNPEEFLDFFGMGVDLCVQELKNIPDGRLEDEDELIKRMLSFKNWSAEKFYEMRNKNLESPLICLGQRDCWNNNFMFKHDITTGEPIGVILCDWQWAYYDHPAIDLATLIFTSTNAKMREHCMDYILQEYFRTLQHVTNSLGTPIDTSFDQFKKEFYEIGISGTFIQLSILQIAFSRIDSKFPDKPIMKRFVTALREILRLNSSLF